MWLTCRYVCSESTGVGGGQVECKAAHIALHGTPHYPMQIRISQISCSAAGHLAIAAINNPPCYKYEPRS